MQSTAATFDRTKTIQENFPPIHRPKEEEIMMLDCKINCSDMSTPVNFEECISEHKRFYYNDHHQIYNKIMNHALSMLEKGLAVDS